MSDRRRLELSEVDDWPGELSFSGGEVYGTPAPRTPRMSAPPWRRARDVMHRAFPGAVIDTGHSRLAARTPSRAQFLVPADVNGAFSSYSVLLPEEAAPADYAARARREWRILAQMTREEALPFRAPQPVALLLEGDVPVLVVTHVAGLPGDEHRGADSWNAAALVAAAVHRLDVDAPGPATRREVALAMIASLEHDGGASGASGASGAGAASGAHASLVRDAVAFARTMLPPAEPTRFVHGALAMWRILSSLDVEDARPGVIDFEHAACGDPAQDIASLTRGVKQPMGAAGGLQRFLDDYATAGGAPLEETDVHVYEALLLASTIRQWNARDPLAIPPETQRLVALLKRA